MTWPGSDLMTRAMASAPLPLGRVMSVTAVCCSERGQRQRRADDVENAVGVAEHGLDRNPGKNTLVRAGDDDVPAGGEAPCRNEIGQQGLQAADGGGAILPDRGEMVDTLGEQIGDGRQVPLDGGALLPALIDHLDECAKANGNQEGDDQGGHGAAKRGLRYQQPVIGRFRDRLRQSLDRIGLDARARRVCARHAFSPHGKLIARSSAPNSAEPPATSRSQRFESSFRGLSRVNDSLMKINLVQRKIATAKSPRGESETGTLPRFQISTARPAARRG